MQIITNNISKALPFQYIFSRVPGAVQFSLIFQEPEHTLIVFTYSGKSLLSGFKKTSESRARSARFQDTVPY
jgi:hypothetical protein